MKPIKCKAPDCRAKHKSPSGYCDKHIHLQDRTPIIVREGRRVARPKLWEERGTE